MSQINKEVRVRSGLGPGLAPCRSEPKSTVGPSGPGRSGLFQEKICRRSPPLPNRLLRSDPDHPDHPDLRPQNGRFLKLNFRKDQDLNPDLARDIRLRRQDLNGGLSSIEGGAP
jgi:hypothetical protein